MAKEYNIGELSLSAKIISYMVMAAYTVLTIAPLLWLFYSSFKPHVEIVRHPLALPVEATVHNFTTAWTVGNLGLYFLNSIFYTAVSTVLTVILALAAGYAFAKFDYRITKTLYLFFILGLLVTVHSALVPLFIMETKLHIDNTRFGILLPYIAFGLPFSVYLSTTYIKGISTELIEAAIIDGANYLQIFWNLILPISRPIVFTMTIFTFLGNWNEFVLVATLTSGPILRSLPVGINAFAGGLIADYGLRFAALSIGTVPMIIFYLAFRKQIAQGFSVGALKE